MSDSKIDVRTDPATRAFAARLDEQYRRIWQVVGTIEVAQKVLDDLSDGAQELTPIFSALSLAVETLTDINNNLEPPLVLAPETPEHVN